ncbi:MAG: TraB/GumN family protein [Pseudomonadales bacterium]
MVPGQTHTQAMVSGESNDVAAAANAQAACEKTREDGAAACEIIWLNDEPIATGAELKAALPKNPHPLYLWRYQGASATVYLAGSIHILKPSLYPLPAPFEAAFDAAERLVVEVNVGAYDPVEVQKATLSRALLPGDKTLKGQLSEETFGATKEALAKHGIDIELLNRGKPAMVMQQLILARLMALGYPPTTGVEQHFLARSGSREVQELESLEAQLDLLFNQPLELQRQLLIDTLAQADDVDELMSNMVSAWLSGDDSQLLALFEQQTGESAQAKAFNEQLLDERNKQMVQKIKGYLAGDGISMIIIGAAHYVGQAGIIALLEKEGIRGQRIRSDAAL